MSQPGLPSSNVSSPSGGQAMELAAVRPHQRRKASWLIAACLGIGLSAVGILRGGNDTRSVTVPAGPGEHGDAVERVPTGQAPARPQPRFPVVINRSAGPPRVATAMTNFQGQPVLVACSTCHTTTKPNLETRRTEDLDQFHQGLKYQHGNLTCLSCHNAADYDTLRLADTRAVEFADSMTLCSQCHGPQRRDYDLGLHGGMNGHWDLTRGGRTRNTCINCHDPHAPAFPAVRPVLAPRDRISVPGKRAPDQASTSSSHP